jgi:hypothetical protein
MSISERLPVEILQAEVLDWWEAQHEMVSKGLDEKLSDLLKRLEAEIETMPTRSLLRKGKHHKERLEPIVCEFLEKHYAEFTSQLEESFQQSLARVESESVTDSLNTWSYKEMATVGGAAVATIAPLAALPFFDRRLCHIRHSYSRIHPQFTSVDSICCSSGRSWSGRGCCRSNGTQ